MGKILIIKGADFSENAIDTVTPSTEIVLGNLVQGLLDNDSGLIITSGAAFVCRVTSEDYLDIQEYSDAIEYENELWESAICCYREDKSYISNSRIITTTKPTVKTPIPISSLNLPEGTRYIRISVTHTFQNQTTLSTSDVVGKIKGIKYLQ